MNIVTFYVVFNNLKSKLKGPLRKVEKLIEDGIN